MKAIKFLSVLTLIFALGIGVTSCNKVKDADIQKAAQESLAINPDLSGVMVTVNNKVATLTGTVKDEATKTFAENTVSSLENVSSVINQIEVVQPSPDFSALDATINAGLQDAIKDHKTVTATVTDGVITIEGEIKESDLPTLMQKLHSLNPQEVVNNATVK